MKLVDKVTKIVIIFISHVQETLGKIIMVNGDMGDIKMTQSELLEKKTVCDERYFGLD